MYSTNNFVPIKKRLVNFVCVINRVSYNANYFLIFEVTHNNRERLKKMFFKFMEFTILLFCTHQKSFPKF